MDVEICFLSNKLFDYLITVSKKKQKNFSSLNFTFYLDLQNTSYKSR